MKTKYYYSSRNKDEPIQGWTLQDQRLLRELDPARSPKTQIFSYSDELDEEEEATTQKDTTTKYCPTCENYDLRYSDLLHCWYCYSCGNKQGTTIRPIQTNADFDIPTSQKGPYTPYDENSTTQPFIASININKDLDTEDNNADIELVRESANGRIKYYKVRDGGQAAALSAVYEAEGRGR